MSTITVYAFETEGDQSATDWTTYDFEEAREYARKYGYSVIAREYEYADSELIEDYRPGHAMDGTPLGLDTYPHGTSLETYLHDEGTTLEEFGGQP